MLIGPISSCRNTFPPLSGLEWLTLETQVNWFVLKVLYSSHLKCLSFGMLHYVYLLPHTTHTVLLEILQLRSSCSMPVCPRRHATRRVCVCVCAPVCVNMFGGLAKCFREKRTCLSKPIQGRSGPSKQQFLHNDLLQWAWKLPQLAAFITHQPQQTGFCFFLFLLLPSIWHQSETPLRRLVDTRHLDWQVLSNQYDLK